MTTPTETAQTECQHGHYFSIPYTTSFISTRVIVAANVVTCVRLVEYGGVGVAWTAVVTATTHCTIAGQGSNEAVLRTVIQTTAVRRAGLILYAQITQSEGLLHLFIKHLADCT